MKKPEMKVLVSKSNVWNEIFEKLSKERIIVDDGKFRSAGKIFASSAGEPCEKQLRYNFEGAEKTIIDPWPGKEARIGDAVHTEIQKDLKLKFGDSIEIETYYPYQLTDDVKINCKVDAVLRRGEPDQHKLIEIKTVKDSEGKEPDYKHWMQIQFYLGVMGLQKAALCYFKRSNGRHINTFEVVFDQEAFEYIVDKFYRIVEDENLEYSTDSCNFCPYSKLCPYFKPKGRKWN